MTKTLKGDIKVTPSPEAGAGPGPERAPADPVAIAAEIQALRRGRGLRGDVTGRIGPLLRELAAGPGPATGASPSPGSDAAEVRRALAARLGKLTEALPGDLRMAILAALGLHPETSDMRTYDQRKEWVARQVDRVARTVERRIDEAQDLLAQEVAAQLARGRAAAADAAGDWYIERFSAVYLLDGAAPEAIERRVIRSAVDGLAELAVALDVPVDSGQPRLPLKLEMISGGELELVQEMARTRTRYVIRLPRPLLAGQRHEYQTRIRVLPSGPLRDYYVFRPERRCDQFDLRVRFDRDRVPAWVRRVDGEDVHSYNTYEGAPGEGELVGVDPAGEASASFSGLRQHFGSGLQWSW